MSTIQSIPATPAARSGNPWAAVMPRKIDGSPIIEDSVALSGTPPAGASRPNVAPRDIPERFAAGSLSAAAPGQGVQLQLVLVGTQASGKAVQAERLAQEYHVAHISVGQLLRNEIASGSKLGQALETAVKSGNESPAGLVNQVLEKRFQQTDISQGFVLDGYTQDLATIPAIESFRESHHLDNLKVVQLEDQGCQTPNLPVLEYFRSRGEYFEVEATGSTDDVADSLGAMVLNFASDPVRDYHLTR